MRRVLMIGATSAIARETARCFARDGDILFLTGRNEEQLKQEKADLEIRGAEAVHTATLDVLDFTAHSGLIEQAVAAMNGIDMVLVAHGSLGNQASSEKSAEEAVREININFSSVVSLLTPVAEIMSEQKNGTIAVISSVAGDRGRMSNYTYGSTKGALNTWLQGLRNRLWHSGVKVVTVKPGFVDTPMTADLPKNKLFAEAEEVGQGIYKAMLKGKENIYLPWFWRWIMLIICHVPEKIFNRLKL